MIEKSKEETAEMSNILPISYGYFSVWCYSLFMGKLIFPLSKLYTHVGLFPM